MYNTPKLVSFLTVYYSNCNSKKSLILFDELLERKSGFIVDATNIKTTLWRHDDLQHEMTKITNSNQSHNSCRKYKSENKPTRTSEYIRSGIRCHGGVSIPCWPFTPAVSPISTFDKRYDPSSRSVCQERLKDWYETYQTTCGPMKGCIIRYKEHQKGTDQILC
jgi:hypothetical protein